MDSITFGFTALHKHGTAFWDYLGLRRAFFVDQLRWDVRHDDQFEMDQYDNPSARYALVLRDGLVVGGARVMPTTAKWGSHTYMLRDAVAGRLIDIPKSVLPSEIMSSDVWECTRLVISDDVRTQAVRSICLSLNVDGLSQIASRNNATSLMSLSPLALERALHQLGYAAERIGEPYQSDEDGRRYAVLQMPVAKVLTTHGTNTMRGQTVHAPSF